MESGAGPVEWGGGGTGSGQFTVASGARLVVVTTYDFTASSTVTGAGTVVLEDGNDATLSFTVAGNYDITGTTDIEGGIADFTRTVLSVGNSLIVGDGTADFYAVSLSVQQLEVDENGSLISGDIAVADQFVWNGGTVSGTGTVTVANNGSSAPNLILGDICPFGIHRTGRSTVRRSINEGQAIASHSDSGSLFALANGAQLINDGTFTADNAVSLTFAATEALDRRIVP